MGPTNEKPLGHKIIKVLLYIILAPLLLFLWTFFEVVMDELGKPSK